jgi:CheY-specific phosphatase CheX
MTSLLEIELYRATALTFERLAFMVASPDSPKEEGHSESPFEAATCVAFTGAFGGRLTVVVYGGVLPAIVGNMVGPENARDADSQTDALGELANVICGNVLTRIAGGEETFRLEASRPVSRKDVARELGKPAATLTHVHVELENGTADVTLNLDKAVDLTMADDRDAK